MALSDRNIVITPNRGKSEDPKIVFSGANAAVSAQNVTLRVYPDNAGTLSFEGSAGQLFSITNTLSGTLFSVNDISGIPSIEVLDTGVIRLAQYNGNVGVGTSTAQAGFKLQVTGNAAVTGRVGIGTSNVFGVSNSLVVYGTVMTYGNLDLANPTGGTSGIYFNDGTYQTTAAGTVQNSSGAAGTVQYSAGGGAFAGDAANFFYDSANARLGIGTGAPTNTLSAWGITPAWFRTSNGSNIFEILVGNATTTAATVGYASSTLSPYSYIKNAGGTNGIAVVNNGSVGIKGITNPQSALDVGGAVAIGTGYAGVTAGPTNGLAVQGSVGIGTTIPGSVLDVNGVASFRSAVSAAGAASFASMASNGTVSGTLFTATGTDVTAKFSAVPASIAATSYNYVIRGTNDTGDKLVCFVNGSTRTADGGANGVTIRNDAGPFNLGGTSSVSNLYGNVINIDSTSTINLDGVVNSTGLISVNSTGLSAGVRFYNTIAARDYRIVQKDTGYLSITDETAAAERLNITSAGAMTVNMATTINSTLNTTGRITVTGSGTAFLDTSGDIYAYRSGGTSGVIFLNSAGNRYLYYNGSGYELPGAGVTVGGTVNAGAFTVSADALNRVQQGVLVLRNGSPTAYFRDTDHMSAMLHCNGNLFYILRGGVDTETWTQVNGQWPMYIDLSNNNAQFGAALTAVGEVTAYSSDRRLKENITNIPDALNKVLSLNGVTFSWMDETKDLGFYVSNKDDVGVIAQEVQAVLPEAVRFAPFDRDEKGNSRSGENYLTVQYEKLTALLIEAVKEQQKQIDDLKNKVAVLESKLPSL